MAAQGLVQVIAGAAQQALEKSVFFTFALKVGKRSFAPLCDGELHKEAKTLALLMTKRKN